MLVFVVVAVVVFAVTVLLLSTQQTIIDFPIFLFFHYFKPHSFIVIVSFVRVQNSIPNIIDYVELLRRYEYKLVAI